MTFLRRHVFLKTSMISYALPLVQQLGTQSHSFDHY